MPNLLQCQITTNLIEFHIVLKRNIEYLSDSGAILYPELKGAKLKYNFTLWKKSKAKNNICKQSLGSVIRNIRTTFIHFTVRASRGSKPLQRKDSSI